MVSVVVPTYNNSCNLIITIQNILNQNIPIVEIVVVDDCSTDDTFNQIKMLDCANIKYYKNKKNLGSTMSRIVGIKKSSHHYIAFLDDDDSWSSNKLKKQLDVIKNNICDFVMCNYIVNNSIDKKQYKKKLTHYADNFLYNIIRRPGPFLQCCLFQKKFLLQCLGCFDPKSEPSEDWDFFISISKYNPIIKNINENLFQWNLSLKSQSANYKNETLAIEYIINKHYKYLLNKSSTKNLSYLFRKLACMFFYIKNFNKTDYYFNKSITINPFSLKSLVLQAFFFLPQFTRIKILSLILKKLV